VRQPAHGDDPDPSASTGAIRPIAAQRKACHDNTEFYAKLSEFLGGLGIDFIDLSFEFKAREGGGGVLDADRHLNFLGNQVVAEVLAAHHLSD